MKIAINLLNGKITDNFTSFLINKSLPGHLNSLPKIKVSIEHLKILMAIYLFASFINSDFVYGANVNEMV